MSSGMSLMQKIGALIMVGTGLSLILYRRAFRVKDITSKLAVFHNVLFFPDAEIPCRSFLLTPKGCRRKNCPHSHDKNTAFAQLILRICNAKHSISLCMFSITCNELADAVLMKHQQGAAVRIITDTVYMNLNGSRISDFMKYGIPVRHHRSTYHMHHKFLIIDGEIVITGSFNWTQSAVIGNNENVLVTNHEDVVRPYTEEFSRLWDAFQPTG